MTTTPNVIAQAASDSRLMKVNIMQLAIILALLQVGKMQGVDGLEPLIAELEKVAFDKHLKLHDISGNLDTISRVSIDVLAFLNEGNDDGTH